MILINSVIFCFSDKLVDLQPSTGLRFNGQGYAIVDSRALQLRSKSSIILSFKTFATDGLLFLASKGQTYLSIELYKGKVLYQVGFIKLNKFFSDY